MSKVSQKLSVWAIALAMVAMLGLAACSGSNTESSSTDSEAPAAAEVEEVALSAEGADPSSIMAVSSHSANEFTNVTVAQVSTCATCHPYDTLVAAGEGLLVDMDSGTVANPHSNHQYLDCTDCHSATEQSVLYCNSCHEFALAEGWANPTTNAAQCAYEFDVSGLDLPPYSETGRDMTVLPPEELNGVAQMEANPTLAQEMMASFMASAMGPEAFAAAVAAGAL